MAAALGLAVTPWGVLEAGALTGKPLAERRWPEDGVAPATERAVAALTEVGAEVGATPAQVAIAWLLHRDGPPTIVPIVASRRAEQIVDNLGAVDVRLMPEHVAALDASTKPQLGFPRSFLESENVRGLIYGTTYERIVT
jgi:aryl-alcohol dehydrogenase-like predicted oxidoreductase